ncbi:MAG TPA: caspase family protein [Bacteroidales bacterium]|nr:caspase family protein [Bacteroidales bacterium]
MKNRNNLPKWSMLLISSLLIMFLISKQTSAQTLHCIIAGATNEQNSVIREGTRLSIDAMMSEIGAIEKNTSVRRKVYELTGTNFKSENLQKTIGDLNCNENDVILFYYNGHGFRYRDQSDKWPTLFMGYHIEGFDDTYLRSISLSKIANELKAKGARLTILIVDCCNGELSVLSPSDIEVNGIASLNFSVRNSERFKELYEQSSGFIIVSSSEPGQTSGVSSRYGGYFTNSFLEIHKELTSISNYADWNDLLEKTKERTISVTQLNYKKQTPQFQIEIIKRNNSHPSRNWQDVITTNSGAFANQPNNFVSNNPYRIYQFPVARIIMFKNNDVLFLMSDNYIVKYNPFDGGMFIAGYRAITMQAQTFQWDLINPVNSFHTNVFGVDYYGKIWEWNNYRRKWDNVGVVYY